MCFFNFHKNFYTLYLSMSGISENNSDKNEDENNNNSGGQYNKDIIKDFWENSIWNIDQKIITNPTVIGIFNKLNQLLNELETNNTLYNFDENYEVMIINNKKNIKKQIYKFKKENLPILKIHADCFYDYYVRIAKYIGEKNLVPNINLTVPLASGTIKNIAFEHGDILNHLNLFFSNIKFDSTKKNYKKYNDNLNNQLDSFDSWKELMTEKLKFNINSHTNSLINFINSNINNRKKFIIIDIENILKSFKVQYWLRTRLSKEEYLKYFKIWFNGDFQTEYDNLSYNDNNISLSEYSSKTKYIEPFTSLGIKLKYKIKLIKIIICNLLKDYNVISILTTNKKDHMDKIEQNKNFVFTKSQSKSSSIQDDVDNNLFIKITYKKTDIREQDDHLMLFIYTFLNINNIDVLLISNDKFKWYFDHKNIIVKNFKYLYDFDNLTKELIIDNAYTQDVYKYNEKYFQFPFYNYPIINDDFFNFKINNYLDKIIIINKNDLANININNFKQQIDLEKNFNEIKKYLIFYSVQDITLNNSNIKNNYINIIIFIQDYCVGIKTIFYHVFNFLNSYTKKEIFKISIGNNQKIFNPNQITNLLFSIEKYKTLIKMFQIIKVIFVKFYTEDKDIILSNTKIFSIIIEIYDEIYANIYKIRKLSNSNSNLKDVFTKLNILFVYIRKQEFFKKNL